MHQITSNIFGSVPIVQKYTNFLYLQKNGFQNTIKNPSEGRNDLELLCLSNETCFPLLYNTLVSTFHLIIQKGVVDKYVCLLWNLHKHIEHGGSTFLRQSDSFRESLKVQPTRMQRPVIHIAFLNIWRKPVRQSQVAATTTPSNNSLTAWGE